MRGVQCPERRRLKDLGDTLVSILVDATEILRFALNDIGKANKKVLINNFLQVILPSTYLLKLSQLTSASTQHTHALVDIIGTDNDIRLVAIGKGIHVLDEDFFAGQLVKDGRE